MKCDKCKKESEDGIIATKRTLIGFQSVWYCKNCFEEAKKKTIGILKDEYKRAKKK